jgi:molecular chaperone DnaK (HSP70)
MGVYLSGCLSAFLALALPFSSGFTPRLLSKFSNPGSTPTYAGESIDDNSIGIGIDLGTTFSAVALLDEQGIPRILEVENGRTMPSVVRLSADTTATPNIVVGSMACADEFAYRNVKRIIGTGGKISSSVASLVPHVRVNANGKTYKKYNLPNQLHDAQAYPTVLQSTLDASQTIHPEFISTCILEKLLETANQATNKTISRAVIGVPAYFHDEQRASTIRAAQAAGILKVKLLREPEAAALAYGVGKEQVDNQNKQSNSDELVLVIDLGGGTYDVSMLLVGGGMTEIISTSGDTELGGSDFDGEIARYLTQMLVRHGATCRQWSAEAKNALLLGAERIRIHLSNNKAVNLALPVKEEKWMHLSKHDGIFAKGAENCTEQGTSNSTHVLLSFSRKTMERLCKEQFQAMLRPLREVAIMSGALLPGDSNPGVIEAALELEEERQTMEFADFYEDDPDDDQNDDDLLSEADLLLAVRDAKKSQQKGRKKARNVAKQEKKFRAEKRKLQVPQDTKVRDGIHGRPISRVVLVGGATRMPAVGRLIAALTGIVPQKTVNPDEAVALGCAVHVGVLDGKDGQRVLTPMQAAILRAVAKKEGLLEKELAFDDEVLDDEEDYDIVESF